MKAATTDGLSKSKLKYEPLIEDGLKELRAIRQELHRSRIDTERLRASSARIMKETWAILHRVEATL